MDWFFVACLSCLNVFVGKLKKKLIFADWNQKNFSSHWCRNVQENLAKDLVIAVLVIAKLNKLTIMLYWKTLSLLSVFNQQWHFCRHSSPVFHPAITAIPFVFATLGRRSSSSALLFTPCPISLVSIRFLLFTVFLLLCPRFGSFFHVKSKVKITILIIRIKVLMTRVIVIVILIVKLLFILKIISEVLTILIIMSVMIVVVTVVWHQ